MSDYTTIFQELQKNAASDAVPMHMPGHKRNTEGIDFLEELGAKYDITEIPGFDDLHEPRGMLKTAMERAARLWQSQNTFFMVNGSTGGILAAVRAAAKVTGSDCLIMARNSHKSVYNAAELCALRPVYMAPPTVAGFGFCGSISPKSVELSLRENPGAPVILTSPTYEGVTSNISEISIVCHMYGSPLIVDEAHGAHLNLSAHFIGGAVSGGADIAIQSLHKTMSGLTQTALLHLSSEIIQPEDIEKALSVFQTSSPSYPLMASIDGTVDLIEKRGSELFRAWNRRLDRFARRVSALQSLRVPGHSELFECQSRQKTPGYIRRGLGSGEVYGYDRSKILISCESTDTTGVELMKQLRERFGIICEMAAGGYTVAMTGLLDRDEHMERLSSAICTLDDETGKTPPRLPLSQVNIPPRRMGVSTALAEPARSLSLRDARGKIAAEYVWAYPPGIPLVVPGEELTEELLGSFIIQREAGVSLRSSSGGMPRQIRVVK